MREISGSIMLQEVVGLVNREAVIWYNTLNDRYTWYRFLLVIILEEAVDPASPCLDRTSFSVVMPYLGPLKPYPAASPRLEREKTDEIRSRIVNK